VIRNLASAVMLVAVCSLYTVAIFVLPEMAGAGDGCVTRAVTQRAADALLGRPYHQVPLDDLALGKVRQTHVEVRGFVTYELREEDGDLHIRICDSLAYLGMDRSHCIVAECIPELPCEKPPAASRVIVQGISRFDHENGHKWYEVHPVEKLTIVQGGHP